MKSRGVFPRLQCTFCGREIPRGRQYWYVNGTVLCGECLPEFARQDYAPCRCVRGEEERDAAR